MAVLGNTSVISLTLLDGVIGNLNPKTTNVYTLGTSSLKWNNVYATTFTGNLTGNATISAKDGFTYSGIGTASDNVARPIWFAYNGVNGRPVIDNDFKYNPSNNTITIGAGSLSPTQYTGNAATATTASKLSNTSAVGAADRPVYFTNGGVPSQTTYRMAATNVSATGARAITDNLETGIWYVNGTNVTGLYSQSDGAAYVNKYSDSWIAEIYQDYRTGQIAIRGKNNGTWQAWRQVLDSSNYTDYTVTKTGTGASGTWGISVSGNAATATKFASAQSVALTGDVTGTASSQAGWSIATTIGAGKVTNAMLAGSIANNKLANSSITIAGNSVALGGSLAADTLRTSLGLSSAIHFIGKATVAITDGSTTDPAISGYTTKTAGDVVIDKDNSYEYIWTAEGKWERLGSDGSYKTTQTAVDSGAAATNKWVSRVQQNANGNVTITMGTLVTTGEWSGNAGSATKLKTARTLTIGSTGKTFDGSADVSWTLAEIDAAAASHTHGNITNDGKLGTASRAVVTDANKNITVADLSVSNPTDASSEAISFIDTISQNSQGKITPTRKSVRVATTTVSGIVSTTTQSFAGAKTFGNITISGTTDQQKRTISSSSTLYLNTASNCSIIFQKNGTNKWSYNAAGTVIGPSTDDEIELGTTTARWKDIHSVAYNSSFKADTIKVWGKTGPYDAGWKRVCALNGYNGYGAGRVYINGNWSNEEPTLAIFDITFSNSNYAHIKQIICAKKTTPDKVRLVYSGTGGKWYFDIHIPARTASSSTGNRFVTFIGKLTVSEKDETTDCLADEPTTTIVERELVVSDDQPTITVNLASTTVGAFTGADMTTGISGTLGVTHGGTGATSFTADSIIMSGSSTTAALTTRAVTNNTSNTAIAANTNIPTMNTIYYGLAVINNASQTRGVSIYAPTTGGIKDTQALVGNGATTAPKWVNIVPNITITAGTGSATPKINVTVLGQSGSAQSITTASTSVYGCTKLQDGIDSQSTALAATAKAAYTASRAVLQTGTTTAGTFPILYKNTANVTDETAQVKFNETALTNGKATTLNPNTGEIAVGKLKVFQKVTLEYNATDDSLDFVWA